MIEYLLEVSIKEKATERVIKNRVFRSKYMTDEELEETMRAFCNHIKEIYASGGIKIEIVTYEIRVVE